MDPVKRLIMPLSALLLAACATAPAPPLTPPPSPAHATPGPGGAASAALPNPASVFCEQQGNRLEIRTAADGSQSGVCLFSDGSECDEWAYFRGECAPGASQVSASTEAVGETSPAVYSPGLVTPDPAAYDGWQRYADDNHGFAFRYPPAWQAELDLRADSTSYQHLLWLHAPDKPVKSVVMVIAFESTDEDYGLQRTGIGAGELVERGSVMFLGEPAKRNVLSLEGRDMEVLYGTTGLFDRDGLRFAISLDYTGVERLGLPELFEQTADLVVASFERTR